jgi:mannose-1-phosphate guanylyltransferase
MRSMSGTTPEQGAGPDIVPPVLIHPSAVIDPSCRIGPDVWVGPRVVLNRGVRVKNSILLDNVEVGSDACVINAVVGWNAKIGAWARVEGSLEDAEHLNATYKGLKIPTATVMGSDVVVGEGVVVRNCIVLPHKELKSSYHNEVLM